jgi:hypothetical protein
MISSKVKVSRLSSAGSLNNHGQAKPSPARVSKSRGADNSTPTRVRKKPAVKKEIVVAERQSYNDNDEDSVSIDLGESGQHMKENVGDNASYHGGLELTSSHHHGHEEVETLKYPSVSIVRHHQDTHKTEFLQEQLDSTQRQLDLIRRERNDLLEDNRELEYKCSTLTDRMETSLLLAEAAKADAGNHAQKREFQDKRIAELERAHKSGLDGNTRAQEELVNSKLENAKLMANLRALNDEKDEMEDQMAKLMQDSRSKLEVAELMSQLEGMRRHMAQRMEEAESAANELQRRVDTESKARGAEERKNVELRADLGSMQEELSKRESQLEESLSQTMTLHQQLKESRAALSDKANEIQSLTHMQYEREAAQGEERRRLEERRESAEGLVTSLREELEASHKQLASFMKQEQEAQAALHTQLAAAKKETQEKTVAFHEAEKALRHWKAEHDSSHSRLSSVTESEATLKSSVKEKESSLVALQNECDELRAQLAASESALAVSREQADSTATRLREELSSHVASKDEVSSRVRELQATLDAREKELQTAAGMAAAREVEHAAELKSVMEAHHHTVDAKCADVEHSMHQKASQDREQAAQEATEQHRRECDDLVRKHVRIIEQLADMHRAELDSLEHRHESDLEQQREILHRVQSLTQEKDQIASEELTRQQQQVAAELEQRFQLEKSVLELTQRVEDRTAETVKASEENELLQKQLVSAQETLKTVQEEHQSMNKNATILAVQLREAAREREEAAEAATVRFESSQQELAAAKAEKESLSGSLKAMEGQFTHLVKGNEEVTANLRVVRASLELAETENSRLTRSQQETGLALDRCKAELLTTQESHRQAEARCDDLQAKLTAKQTAVKSAEGALAELKLEADGLRGEIDLLTDRMERLKKAHDAELVRRQALVDETREETRQLKEELSAARRGAADMENSYSGRLEQSKEELLAHTSRLEAALRTKEGELAYMRNERDSFKTEHAFLVAEHEETLAAMTSQKATLAAEKKQAADEHAAAVAAMEHAFQSSLESERSAAASKEASLRLSLEGEKSDHRDTVRRLEEDHNSLVESMRSSHWDTVHGIEEERRLEREQEGMSRLAARTQHREELDRVTTELTARLSAERGVYEREKVAHQDSIHRLTDEHRASVDEERNVYERERTAHRDLMNKLTEQHKAALDDERSVHEKERTAHRAAMHDLVESHKTSLGEERSAHKSALEAAAAQHKEALHVNEEEHNSAIASLEAAHKAAAEHKDATHKAVLASLAEEACSTEREHQEAMRNQELSHARGMAALKEAHLRNTKALEESAQASAQAAIEEHRRYVAALEEKYGKRVTAAEEANRALLAQTEESHRHTTQLIEEENARVVAGKVADISRLRETVSGLKEAHQRETADAKREADAALSQAAMEYAQERDKITKTYRQQHEKDCEALAAVTTSSEANAGALKHERGLRRALESQTESAEKALQEVREEQAILARSRAEHVQQLEAAHGEKRAATSALEAQKHLVLQQKADLEGCRASLEECRKDVEAHREDLTYHKNLLASHQAEMKLHAEELNRLKQSHEDDLSRQQERHRQALGEWERSKQRELDDMKEAMAGSARGLEAQLAEAQRQLRVERDAQAGVAGEHSQALIDAQTRYDEAKGRHEAAVAEHLQAEELLWKEKEELTREHAEAQRLARELGDKSMEQSLVHASERARSAAEVQLAKEEAETTRERLHAAEQHVKEWEQRYAASTCSVILLFFLLFLFFDVSVTLLSIYCCLLALSDTNNV